MTTEDFRNQVLAELSDFTVVQYPSHRVVDQARSMLPFLQRDLPLFQDAELPVTEGTLARMQDAIEVLVEEGADRADLKMDILEYQRITNGAYDAIQDLKKELILWAKASELTQWNLFNLNMGQGSVPRLLESATLLQTLITRHKDSLLNKPRIQKINELLQQNISLIEKAREERGFGKSGGIQDTEVIQKTTFVLYRDLRLASRIGQALFFDDRGNRSSYRMQLLQPKSSSKADDDAPVLEDAGDLPLPSFSIG